MAEFLLEVVFEILGELFFAYGFEFLFAPFQPARSTNRFLAFVGLFILAVASSLVVSFLLPHRLIPMAPFPGISLVISPLATGAALYLFGNWRRGNDKNTTVLATFWGGAFFSFVFALTRLIIVNQWIAST